MLWAEKGMTVARPSGLRGREGLPCGLFLETYTNEERKMSSPTWLGKLNEGPSQLVA